MEEVLRAPCDGGARLGGAMSSTRPNRYVLCRRMPPLVLTAMRVPATGAKSSTRSLSDVSEEPSDCNASPYLSNASPYIGPICPTASAEGTSPTGTREGLAANEKMSALIVDFGSINDVDV